MKNFTVVLIAVVIACISLSKKEERIVTEIKAANHPFYGLRDTGSWD